MKAWYFSRSHCRTRYSAELIASGKTLSAYGKLELCSNGMHASANIMDALRYAPGPIIWQVELSGEILKSDDKMCARHREHLWRVKDSDDLLRSFARRCALRHVDKWDCPDVVLRWLKTGSKDLREAAARSAHNSASASASASAASAASAAYYSATAASSAYSASSSAASAAAASAASAASAAAAAASAAYYSERKWQRSCLTAMAASWDRA